MLPASDVQTRLEELRDRRKLLVERFESRPADTHLAVEIKVIDDQVAECNCHIQADRRRRK